MTGSVSSAPTASAPTTLPAASGSASGGPDALYKAPAPRAVASATTETASSAASRLAVAGERGAATKGTTGGLLQQSAKKTVMSAQAGLAFGHVLTTDASLEIERARVHERCAMSPEIPFGRRHLPRHAYDPLVALCCSLIVGHHRPGHILSLHSQGCWWLWSLGGSSGLSAAHGRNECVPTGSERWSMPLD
jgi:hypothetical protein